MLHLSGPQALLGAILFITAGWDIAKRRIPNPLVFLGLLLGLAIALQHGGIAGITQSILGILLAFGLTFPQWRMGWMGGGDAKLMMVVGAFLGPRAMVDVLLWAMVIHGAVALAFAAWRALAARTGRLSPPDLRLPMAVAIALGFFLALGHPLLRG